MGVMELGVMELDVIKLGMVGPDMIGLNAVGRLVVEETGSNRICVVGTGAATVEEVPGPELAEYTIGILVCPTFKTAPGLEHPTPFPGVPATATG